MSTVTVRYETPSPTVRSIVLPGFSEPFWALFARFCHKQQMVGAAQVFFLFAGVMVETEILGKAFFIRGVDFIFQQFADTVGGHLVQHL